MYFNCNVLEMNNINIQAKCQKNDNLNIQCLVKEFKLAQGCLYSCNSHRIAYLVNRRYKWLSIKFLGFKCMYFSAKVYN